MGSNTNVIVTLTLLNIMNNSDKYTLRSSYAVFTAAINVGLLPPGHNPMLHTHEHTLAHTLEDPPHLISVF